MRVPKVETYKDAPIRHVSIQKPIIIPRFPVITNDKQRDKVIKQIERYCRASLEYKDLIKYLRENVDMNECTFFSGFKAGKRKGMIQIHHAPFDLYSLVSIVMKKQEEEKGYINELEIVDEVMLLHYIGLVGLIPLSVTVHELVHDGKLIVPLNCVYGRFVEFTERYFNWIDDDMMVMLNENIELTRHLTKKDLSILNVSFVYTDVDGYNLPKKLEVDDVKLDVEVA